MAGTYKTIQGDTWDLIAYKLFGSEKYMKNLIEANWPLLDVLIFPSGIELTVPDLRRNKTMIFHSGGTMGRWMSSGQPKKDRS